MSKTQPECSGPCPMEEISKGFYRCKKCGYEVDYADFDHLPDHLEAVLERVTIPTEEEADKIIKDAGIDMDAFNKRLDSDIANAIKDGNTR